MPLVNYTRFYRRTEFLAALPGPIPEALLDTALSLLVLATPIAQVRVGSNGGAVVTFADVPSAADSLAVDAAIAAFVGGVTTSAPFEYNSFAVSTSTVATPTTKIDQTTPPLDAGTYQVLWMSSLRMQAVSANTGIQADVTLTRSDGVVVHQDDSWDLNVRHAFNGALTFQVLAGQTIRSQLTFQRLGASGTAELSGARITVDKIS